PRDQRRTGVRHRRCLTPSHRHERAGPRRARRAAAAADGRVHRRDGRRARGGQSRRRLQPASRHGAAAGRRVLAWADARAPWGRTPGRFADLDDVEEVGSAEEAVRAADVLVTATSSSEPVVDRDWLKAGVHINAVGSALPTTRELDTRTVADASFFVDRRESTLNESGDFLIPLHEGAIGTDHIRAEIGEIVLGDAVGRRSPDELTVFKSLGIAVEDLAAAEYVVARAERENAGAAVSL